MEWLAEDCLCQVTQAVCPLSAEQEQPRRGSSSKGQRAAAHWIYLGRVQRVYAQVEAVAQLLMRLLLRVLHTPSRSERAPGSNKAVVNELLGIHKKTEPLLRAWTPKVMVPKVTSAHHQRP